ncbi:ABC transporter substrate-binding protein [Nocardioides phosphati]|uniref:ABC transporter substrate-binding protein n=1 Tax=Nocardioides phosphati TaxID=1867775 RepID=A0ABQ2NF18_9ACTN|nr:MlaD family protein [Nocardioides phosphati]GGO93918.1 ABC transporter substrate-binding protein [Nocardioides phosphati]
MTRPALLLALAPLVLATGCGTLRDVPLPGLVSGPTYRLTGVFGNVLGLPDQAAVKMNGATIGEVDGIETADYAARVHMKISKEFAVPADVRAEVRLSSPMGDSFIEFTDPRGGGAATLSPGSEIGLAATSEAPGISDVLSAASTLLTGGSFADMKVVLSELNTALKGNGDNIHRLLGQLDGMTTRLNDHTAQFDLALGSLDRLGRRLAADRRLIGTSMAELEPAIRVLSAQRKQVLDLMAQLRRLSEVGTATLSQSREDMLSVLADLTPILDTLTRNQRNFEGIMDGIRDFGRQTDSATFGAFLDFDLSTLFDQDVLPAPSTSTQLPGVPSGN